MQTHADPPQPLDRARPAHVLILGGTLEARMLAEALAAQGLAVTYALHAPTGTLAPPRGCRLHQGSFGGQDGLLAFIRAQGVTVFVNALHPHAETMQRRTRTIEGATGLPCFHLQRPLWQAAPGDRWQQFDSAQALNQAVQAAGHGRLFLTVGPQSLAMFEPLSKHATLFARRFDQRRGAALAPVTWIDGTPDPSLDDEIALLGSLDVAALVTKNSGGRRPAKLDAAARLKLPVYLLRPAPLPDEPGQQRFTDWRPMRDAILAVTGSGSGSGSGSVAGSVAGSG